MTNHLQRFIDAQDKVFLQVLNELNSGQKQTHWMWYIFPQIQGLGRSQMAIYYSIKDINEANDYCSRVLKLSYSYLSGKPIDPDYSIMSKMFDYSLN